MMGLREFVELFDKNEVKNLFNALSLCIEYVRIDLHVFNIGPMLRACTVMILNRFHRQKVVM